MKGRRDRDHDSRNMAGARVGNTNSEWLEL